MKTWLLVLTIGVSTFSVIACAPTPGPKRDLVVADDDDDDDDTQQKRRRSTDDGDNDSVPSLPAAEPAPSPDASAPSPDVPKKTPAETCVDYATAVAKALERCGDDYQESYDAFVQAVADGDCDNIVGIRDDAALRNVCFPFLASSTCAILGDAANYPSACRQQLLD